MSRRFLQLYIDGCFVSPLLQGAHNTHKYWRCLLMNRTPCNYNRYRIGLLVRCPFKSLRRPWWVFRLSSHASLLLKKTHIGKIFNSAPNDSLQRSVYTPVNRWPGNMCFLVYLWFIVIKRTRRSKWIVSIFVGDIKRILMCQAVPHHQMPYQWLIERRFTMLEIPELSGVLNAKT